MKILHFADLHLGVESYSRLNPDTGLSTRLEDFLRAFDQLVDYAVENEVDLVLFCGDAYHSREPGQTQQREFAKRIRRLSTSGIATFLLVGNHDMHNAIGRATSTEIFDTLSVDNVYVSSRPDIYRIPTRSGPIQIVSLPWLRRSALIMKEDAKNLDLEQLNQKMEELLTGIIAANSAKLDPALPAILAAHVWVSGARAGSERAMTIGQEHMLLLSNIAQPAFDYIALGHIHKHQVLKSKPPVVYAGSLAGIDFGEENDDKGFCLIEIKPGENEGEREVIFDFHPVCGRRFLTIDVNIDPPDIDPTLTVLRAVAEKEEKILDAIVRLNIGLSAEHEGLLRDSDIRNALAAAHYFTVTRDVKRDTRLRLDGKTAGEITPLEALKVYLESKNVPEQRASLLLEYAGKLIEDSKINHS